jgi:hypothetical protein
LPKNPYTLAGFEHESYVPYVDAMTTAPGQEQFGVVPVTRFFSVLEILKN